MVTSRNLSAYDGVPPAEGENRKIAGGPLYPLEKVKSVAEKAGGIWLWTTKCINKAQDMGLDTTDVGLLVLELAEQDYRDSEWCENGKGAWAACDAYRMVKHEYNEAARKVMRCDYFLKFGIAKSGAVLLMVSCHTSN
jgi:hypothetical protein